MADYSDLMKLEKKVKPSPSVVIASPTPTPMETPPSDDLPANQQRSKPAKKQADLPVNQLPSKEASQQGSKEVNQQTSKQLKKFSSYLREESLKALKKIAFMSERKDYEVLQEAVDFFLEHKESR